MSDITQQQRVETLRAAMNENRLQAIVKEIGDNRELALAVRLEINRVFDPAAYEAITNPEHFTANGFGVSDIEDAVAEIEQDNAIEVEPGLLEKIVDDVLATDFWQKEIENYSISDGNTYLAIETRRVMEKMGFVITD
jgi:hypothetical protein